MPKLIVDGVSKYYPASGVQANDRASLDVDDGEIHALVGENGAGKSTLVRVLCGLEKADSGRIELDGRPVEIPDPAAARRLGIGVVHQHFSSVGGFTVAENLALGEEPTRAGFWYDRSRARREALRAAAELGFELDPDALASSLTLGQRQQLEILKALRGEARLLVLDEPTAALAEQEIRSLFETLSGLRARGRTVVLITHKVREVKEISDAVTVMRAGRTVARVRTQAVGEAELSALMVGGSERRAFSRAPRAIRGAPVFEMRSASLGGRRGSPPAIDRLSLRVEAGEILGLCGVAGNGLAEVEDLAAGLARPSTGDALFGGRPVPRHRRPGLGYVPADRMRRGACSGATLADNLAALDRRRFFPRGLADGAAMRDFASGAIGRFSIKASPGDPIESLSGGNIQKSVLARELSGRSAFLVASNPTWGLDAASAEEIYERLEAARDEGAAILLLSYNLDDILVLSDRIGALYKGRLVCDLANGAAVGRELLGEYMLGLRDDFAADRARSLS